MVYSKKRFVLTLDGGGMRGIVPTMVLMDVEARTGVPIGKMFDLIVGASTGAILAAGVCVADESGEPMYTPSKILELYEQKGPQIFAKEIIRSWIRWIHGSKYSELALENTLETHFGCSQLQNTITHLMIPAYNITTDTPIFFKSWVPKHKCLLLKDILRAATAAPTFFKPKKMEIPNKLNGNLEDALLYDGAIFGNNMSACAYVDALEIFPNDEIHILSVGTGDNKVYSDAENPGTLPFVDTLAAMIFSASENVVNYQMRRLIKERYTRIQLTKDSHTLFSLDDASPRAIQELKDDARTVIQQQSSCIDRFVTTYLNS